MSPVRTEGQPPAGLRPCTRPTWGRSGQLTGVTRWLLRHPAARGPPVGYFGGAAAAAAALWAAGRAAGTGGGDCLPGWPARPAWPQLGLVRPPTLLIVDGQDEVILSLNRRARQQLSCESDLAVIPGYARLPGEPGAQEQVARLAAGWFPPGREMFTGAFRRHCRPTGQQVLAAGTLATMSPGWSAPNVMAVRNVPWWGLLSSGAAPVLMVGGWMAAASLQPRSVDPMAETVSALAAVDAAERWVMTVTFLAVGVCYIATGLALRPAGIAGRLILVAGAGVGMLVAAFPQPADGGSLLHAIWASAGFCALTVWPAAAWRRGPGVPWALRPAVCAIAAAMLVLPLAWFAAEVVTGGGHAGLAERVLGVAQAVWPLTVVLSCRHLARETSAHSPAPPEPAPAERRPSYTPAAATPRAMTAVSLGSSGKIAPRAGRTTAKVPAQREAVGPAGADQGP